MSIPTIWARLRRPVPISVGSDLIIEPTSRLGGWWALCFKRAFSTSVALGLVTVSITLGWEVKLLSFNRIVGNLPVQCFCFAQEVTLFILRIYPLTVAFKGLHRMLV